MKMSSSMKGLTYNSQLLLANNFQIIRRLWNRDVTIHEGEKQHRPAFEYMFFLYTKCQFYRLWKKDAWSELFESGELLLCFLFLILVIILWQYHYTAKVKLDTNSHRWNHISNHFKVGRFKTIKVISIKTSTFWDLN